MKQTKLQAAKPRIEAFFETSSRKILKPGDLRNLFEENRSRWNLPKGISANGFATFLVDEGIIARVDIDLPYRKEVRFLRGPLSPYAVALSLRPQSYLSHYTAVYLHHLTQQVPKTIYVNSEQPPKRGGSRALEQRRIDAAFRRPPRKSNNVALLGDLQVCAINGMQTGNLGVVEMEGPSGETVAVTNLERTLIDIAVRPFYAGGVFEVLEAYRKAQGRASINRLAAMLAQLNYIYPYHQAVGFYLEKAGVFSESAVGLLRKPGMAYDFYLTHQMKEVDYSPRWRLYFPKGL